MLKMCVSNFVCFKSVCVRFVCDSLCDNMWFVCGVLCVFVFLLNECASVLCGVFCGVVWFACFACLCVPVCVWC